MKFQVIIMYAVITAFSAGLIFSVLYTWFCRLCTTRECNILISINYWSVN